MAASFKLFEQAVLVEEVKINNQISTYIATVPAVAATTTARVTSMATSLELWYRGG